jgi:hypothetical protein
LVADAGEHSAHLDRFVFLDQDFLDDSRHGGGNLGVDLVGGNLHEWFVDVDTVADSF